MSSALPPSPNGHHGARSDSDFDAPEYEPLSDVDFDAPVKKKQKKKVDDNDLPARRAGGTSGGSGRSRRSSTTGMTLRNATLRRRPGRYREPEDMPETKPAWVHKAVPFNPELAKFVSYSAPIDSPTGFAPSLDQYNAYVAAKQADEARRQEAEQKGEKHVARVTVRAEVLDGTTKGPRVVHLPPLPQPQRRYEDDDSDEETVEEALLWMDLSNCTRWNLIDYQNYKLKSRHGEDLEISNVFRNLHLRLRDIIAFVELYNKELALYEAYRARVKATQPADNNLEYYREGGGIWFVDQLTTHSTTDEEIRQGQEYLRQLGEQNVRDLKGWKGERSFFFHITGMEHLELDYLNEAVRNGKDADYGDLTIGSMEWATEKFLQGTGVDEQVARQEAEARSSGSLHGGGGDQQQQAPPMGLDGQAYDDNEEEEEDEVIELTSPFDADFALDPLQPPYYPAAPHTPVGVPREMMQPIIGFGQGYPAGGGGFGMVHNFDGFGGMPVLAGSSDYAFAAMMPQGPTNLNWWQQDPDLGLDAFFGDQFPNAAAAAAADPLVPDNVAAAAAGMPLGVDAFGINNAGYDNFAFGFEAGHEMNPFFGDQPPNADAAAPLAPQDAVVASMAPGDGDDDAAFGANADFDINRMLSQLRNAVEPLAPAGGAAALPLVDDAFGLDAVGHEMNPVPGAAVAPVVSPIVSPVPDVPVGPDQEDLHDDESGSSQSPPASIVFPFEEWQLHAFRRIDSPSATIDPRLLDITGFAPPLPAAICDAQEMLNAASVADPVATPQEINDGGPAPVVGPDDDLRFDEEWHASLRPRTYSISRLRGDDPDYPPDFVETMFSKPSQMDQTDDSATGTAAAVAAAPVVDPAQEYAIFPTPARGQEYAGENLKTAATTGSAWNEPAHLAFAETPGGQFGWQQAPQVAESDQFVMQQAPVAETNHAAAAAASSSRVPSKCSLDEFTNEPVVATPTSARSRARAHKDTFALESDDDFKGVHVPICEPDDDDYKPKKGKTVHKRNNSGTAAAAKGTRATSATPRKKKPTITTADGEATPQTPKAAPAPKVKKADSAAPKRKYVNKKKPDTNNNDAPAASVPAVSGPVMPAVAGFPPAALMPAMMPQPPFAPVMPAVADPSFAALMPAMMPQFPSPPRGYCYVQTSGGWGLFPLDGTAPAGVAAGQEASPALVLPEAPPSKPKSTRRKKKEDEEDGTPEKPKPKRARTKKADAASNKGNNIVVHPLCQKETPVPLPPMLKFPSDPQGGSAGGGYVAPTQPRTASSDGQTGPKPDSKTGLKNDAKARHVVTLRLQSKSNGPESPPQGEKRPKTHPLGTTRNPISAEEFEAMSRRGELLSLGPPQHAGGDSPHAQGLNPFAHPAGQQSSMVPGLDGRRIMTPRHYYRETSSLADTFTGVYGPNATVRPMAPGTPSHDKRRMNTLPATPATTANPTTKASPEQLLPAAPATVSPTKAPAKAKGGRSKKNAVASNVLEAQQMINASINSGALGETCTDQPVAPDATVAHPTAPQPAAVKPTKTPSKAGGGRSRKNAVANNVLEAQQLINARIDKLSGLGETSSDQPVGPTTVAQPSAPQPATMKPKKTPSKAGGGRRLSKVASHVPDEAQQMVNVDEIDSGLGETSTDQPVAPEAVAQLPAPQTASFFVLVQGNDDMPAQEQAQPPAKKSKSKSGRRNTIDPITGKPRLGRPRKYKKIAPKKSSQEPGTDVASNDEGGPGGVVQPSSGVEAQ